VIKALLVEQSDLNSESALLVEWTAADGAMIDAGHIVCRVETTKAIIEVPSPGRGQIFHAFPAGASVVFNRPIAYVAETAAEGEEARGKAQGAAKNAPPAVKATKKARQLALQHGLALEAIDAQGGLVTEKHVYAALGAKPAEIGISTIAPDGRAARPYLDASGGSAVAAPDLPTGTARVVVLGAGLGAMQVIDILLNDPGQQPVGCLDDDPDTQGRALFGVPVWGKLDALEAYWREKRFERAIVSISTNIPLRKNLAERCRALGIPLANAIDPTVRLNRGVVLGTGNVLCSLVHVGVATVLGDNNFISSHTSIEHHNRWGSHNTVGPACATSSRVLVGDEVVFGTGIFIQPGVGIGSRCRIASGAVLAQTIPADHAVKMQAQYRVLPLPSYGPP
jgi:sugar O-acyltransferase (sialic acid O-acetyltransferase NeuD family)